jgi:hypothetical protein
LEKVKVEFTYNSIVTPKNAAAGEVLDLVNHQMVLNLVFRTYHSKDSSEEGIKELHKGSISSF